MREPAGALYVARYKWPFRLVAVGFAALLAVLRPNIAETWKMDGWFFGVGAVLAYGFAVSGLLEMFVRQTWLTEKGIFQRSMFCVTKFVPYGHVQELVIERGEALVVKYENNRRLKVHAKEGNPEVIIKAVRPFLNPDIRVVTI